MKRYVKAGVFLFLALFLLLAVPAFADDGPANKLGVGETRVLSFPPRDYYLPTLESLTPDIVSTTADSRWVTGVSEGTGTVRVTYTSIYTAPPIIEEIPVKVYPAPTGIELNLTSVTLGVKEYVEITSTLSEGSYGQVTYSVDNSNLQIVNDRGIMKFWGKEVCQGTLTASTYNGLTASCTVEILPEPGNLRFSTNTAVMFVGETLDINPHLESGYTREGIKLTYNGNTVISLSPEGIVTALAAGYANVYARVYNNHATSCSFSVYDEPKGIVFSGWRDRISLGETVPISMTDDDGNPIIVRLASSDSGIVAIQYGYTSIKAMGLGTCTITASSGQHTETFDVTVIPPPTSVTVSPDSATIKETESVQLTAALNEGASCPVHFYSSNQDIVTVSKTGLVTGVRPGQAYIKASTFNQVMGQCLITVVESEFTYHITPAEDTIGIGKTLQMHVRDMNGNEIPANYSCSNSSMASVGNSGLVTGNERGDVTISAQVADGRIYKATIHVIVIPEYITVTPTSLVLREGQLKSFRLDSDVGKSYFDFTAVSSDPSVASLVNPYVQTVTGEKVGLAIITITSFNGKVAQMLVLVLPAQVGLIPSVEWMDLGVGEAYTVKVTDMYGKSASCSYISSEKSVASVNSKGTVRGAEVGTSFINIYASGNRSTRVRVDVYPAPAYLRLNASEARIPVGETLALEPAVQDGSYAMSIKYATSNKKVASVSADGVITALKAGTATITASTYNNKKATVKVTVGIPPESVSLSPGSLTLGLGEERAFTAVLPSGAAGECTFATEDTSYISVSGQGLVTGLALGSGQVTVTTYNGKTATGSVTVLPAPDSLTMTGMRSPIGVKETMQLNASIPAGSASVIRFESSNTSIATVNAVGLVTGVKPGTATVTASTFNGKTQSFDVTVSAEPKNVKLNVTSAKMGLGDALQLTATLPAGAAGAYAFASSSPSIADVDQTGKVTALAPGKATITVTAYNGRKATCKVTVYRLPDYVTIRPDLSLKAGRTYSLSAKLPSGTYSLMTYASDRPEVATVDQQGKVRGIAPGTAVITVTTGNGKTASCTVTVK